MRGHRATLVRLLALLGACAAAGTGVSASGATYTARSANAANTISAAADWVPPVVSVSSPSAGDFAHDSVTLTAAATDTGGSGVASVRFQYAAASSSTYVDVCTVTTAPYSCTADSTQAPDGSYKVRAIATDNAGYATTSAPVTFTVDNTDPSASVNAPSGTLGGTVTLTAAASDATSGVDTVVFQRAPSGSSTWTTICTDTASPYTCDFSVTGLPSGTYQLRAVVTDNAGRSATSAVITRTVDGVAPTPVAISTTNVTLGTAGRLESGDKLVLRYSEAMNLDSIIGGLSSGSASLTVRLRDSALAGGGADGLDFNGTANLGSINLGTTGFIGASSTATFASTVTATSVSGATQLTITLGARSGNTPTTASSSKLTWAASGSATDLAGNGASGSFTQTTAAKAF